LRILETFRRFKTLIQWNGTHLVEAFEAPLKSQQNCFGQTGQRDSRSTRRNECRTVFRISF